MKDLDERIKSLEKSAKDDPELREKFLLITEYRKENDFDEKMDQALAKIREAPESSDAYLTVFIEWYNMGLFARKKEQSDNKHVAGGDSSLKTYCTLQLLPYLTAAVRLAHDEMRAFEPQAYDYWYHVVLPGLLHLQADTLEAKSKGITLEKWKEEMIQIPCMKCVEREEKWVAKKMVLRLDDSTGIVACSWCGYEELNKSSGEFVEYMNMNDHIELFLTGKFYRLDEEGIVKSPNGFSRAQDKMYDENSLDGVPVLKSVRNILEK